MTRFRVAALSLIKTDRPAVRTAVLVNEQMFLPRIIKLVRSFKGDFSVDFAGHEMYLG